MSAFLTKKSIVMAGGLALRSLPRLTLLVCPSFSVLHPPPLPRCLAASLSPAGCLPAFHLSRLIAASLLAAPFLFPARSSRAPAPVDSENLCLPAP